MYLILLFIHLINYYTSLWHQCSPACVSKCCFLVLNLSQITAFPEFWLFAWRPKGSTEEGRWFSMALVIYTFSQHVSWDASKKRGRLTNERGRIARHRGPLRQSGLGCSANSSSARVKDTHSHVCPHPHTHCHLHLWPLLEPHYAGWGPTPRSLTPQAGQGAR